MAVTKKTAAKKAVKKAVKKVAPKAAVVAKTAPVKKAAPKAAAPAAKVAPKAAVKKVVAKKATTVKLTPNHVKALHTVHGKGETGHTPEKTEIRTLDSLVEKKLLKRGAKDKQTKLAPYHLTNLGKKHTSTPSAS